MLSLRMINSYTTYVWMCKELFVRNERLFSLRVEGGWFETYQSGCFAVCCYQRYGSMTKMPFDGFHDQKTL
jgi:hypothetical protein